MMNLTTTVFIIIGLLLIFIISLMGYIAELLSENCKLKRKIERLKNNYKGE